MSSNKILLLTSTRLESNGIGAIFIRSLLSDSTDFEVHSFIRLPFLLNDSFFPKLRFFQYLKSAYVRIGVIQNFRLLIYKRFFFRSDYKRILEMLESARIETVWVTASSPEVIWLAEKISRAGRDVRVMVWDAPEYLAKNLRISGRCIKELISSFEYVVKAAKRVSVISYNMHKEYLERYQVESLIIRHGVELGQKVRQMSLSGEVKVVFAGSLYSKQEWNVFVRALSSVGWIVDGRKIKIYFVGRYPLAGVLTPPELVLMGEKSFADTLKILSEMDIGYLPYWFSKEHEVVARTSFPGKLSAYAASGLAVFHHAPDYADLTGFLQKYPFGVTCASLSERDVISSLKELINLASSDGCARARRMAFENELSRSAMYERFKMFVNGELCERQS